jgi:hypothetical protein
MVLVTIGLISAFAGAGIYRWRRNYWLAALAPFVLFVALVLATPWIWPNSPGVSTSGLAIPFGAPFVIGGALLGASLVQAFAKQKL